MMIEIPEIGYIKTKEQLRALKQLLEWASLVSYDIETTSDNRGATEFDDNAAIVCVSFTMCHISAEGTKFLSIAVVPLFHPHSPFRKSWKSVLRYLSDAVNGVPKQIAHNGKFDARWLRHFGCHARVTFDTMLAAHLLDENRLKGLKPLAQSILGVEPWAIETSNLLTADLDDVMYYCALDTFYTYELYKVFREELIAQPRLLRIFAKVLMPANEIFIETERHGVWVDRAKLDNAIEVSFRTRADIEHRLREWIPDPDETPGWPTSGRRGKKVEVNFNASNFARWWLFEHLNFRVIERGKVKKDGSPGAPSMAEGTMLELRKDGHPVVDLLLERVKWQKYCTSFVIPYRDLLGDNDRIHTTFKLYGTVTGRLSSGKADEGKLTVRRGKLRGVNLQQVPRDNFIRGLFGSPPGWSFVEADFSQVELRVVAFVARERRMMAIYQQGLDIHTQTAANVLGIPLSKVTKVERKSAKAVNFGFVYGMSAKKFVETAFVQYGLIFTIEEAQAIRRAYFDQFPGLLPWHARQRRLAHEHGRVQSPIGRIRHLPEIDSGDGFKIGEAERQAINSPIQSFASDMNLIAMNIIHDKFRDQGVRAHILGTVHDAINFEVHDDDVGLALPIIKSTMENLPLKRMFGVVIDIPIISDLKIGRHWGDARELSEEEVYSWQASE